MGSFANRFRFWNRNQASLLEGEVHKIQVKLGAAEPMEIKLCGWHHKKNSMKVESFFAVLWEASKLEQENLKQLLWSNKQSRFMQC